MAARRWKLLPFQQAGASLEEHMLVAIQQAMCEHRGNVAAVARQLRISRTTVYARLRQLRDVGMSTGSDEFSVVAQSAGEI